MPVQLEKPRRDTSPGFCYFHRNFMTFQICSYFKEILWFLLKIREFSRNFGDLWGNFVIFTKFLQKMVHSVTWAALPERVNEPRFPPGENQQILKELLLNPGEVTLLGFSMQCILMWLLDTNKLLSERKWEFFKVYHCLKLFPARKDSLFSIEDLEGLRNIIA